MEVELGLQDETWRQTGTTHVHGCAPTTKYGHMCALTLIRWRGAHPHNDFHPSGTYSRHAVVVCETSKAQRRRGMWRVYAAVLDHGSSAVQSLYSVRGQESPLHIHLWGRWWLVVLFHFFLHHLCFDIYPRPPERKKWTNETVYFIVRSGLFLIRNNTILVKWRNNFCRRTSSIYFCPCHWLFRLV